MSWQVLTAMGSMRACERAPEASPLRGELREIAEIAQPADPGAQPVADAAPVNLSSRSRKPIDWYFQPSRAAGATVAYERDGPAIDIASSTTFTCTGMQEPQQTSSGIRREAAGRLHSKDGIIEGRGRHGRDLTRARGVHGYRRDAGSAPNAWRHHRVPRTGGGWPLVRLTVHAGRGSSGPKPEERG